MMGNRGNAGRERGAAGARWVLCAALLLAFAGAFSGRAAAQEGETPGAAEPAGESIAFDIPAGALGTAIEALGRQARLQIVYDPAVIRGARSAGLHATMTSHEALANLLAGTGLTYRFTGPRSVAVERPAGDTTTLSPIVVTERAETSSSPVEGYVANVGAAGTKTDTPLIETPQSITVITADQLKARGVREMGEVLRYTAGATGEPYGPDARGIFFQLRGFNVADEAFFRDGLLTRGSDFASFMSLDPYGAERFEVLRGPSSVLYGQISPGGILNYVSKRPTEETFGEASLEGGYFARGGGSFDIGGPVTEDGTLLYRLTGHGHYTETQVDFVDKQRAFFAPALTWRPDEDTSLTVLANAQYDKTGWANQFLPPAGTALPNPNGDIPRSTFTGEPDFDRYEQTQESIGYQFAHRFDETFTLRQNARFAHFSNEQEGVFGLGLQDDQRTFDRYGDSGESTMFSFAVDTQLETNFATGALDHTVLFGVDYVHNRFSDIGLEYEVDPIDIFDPVYGSPITLIGAYFDSDVTMDQAGAYLQDQIKIGGLSLVGGGRHDWSSIGTVERVSGTDDVQDDSAFSWRVGAIYEFDGGVAPYASYATSFMPQVGTDAQGDPFEPETGEQFEVGVKYQPPGWNAFVTLSAFQLTQQNVLTTDPNDDRFQVQTGEVRSRGIEIEGVASLDFGLDLVAAYAFIDAEITESNDGFQGHTPYGIPEHRASFWADYTIPDGRFAGLGAGFGMRFTGETFGDDENTFKVEDSVVFDASLHYDHDPFSFALNASNLFDTRYVSSCYHVGAGCFYGERLQIVAEATYRW